MHRPEPSTVGVALDEAWDRLHDEPRFRPRYPSEAVVRFVARRLAGRTDGIVLDLGCGAGRHLSLMADFEVPAVGLDYSFGGLVHARADLTRAPAGFGQAKMEALPFADGSLDGIVCYGVVNYTTDEGLRSTIAEMHRTLRRGGYALIVTRSVRDHRFGRGRAVGPRSFVLESDDTNEQGMVMTFLDESDVPSLFAAFSEVSVDRNDFTLGGGTIANADLIIEVRR